MLPCCLPLGLAQTPKWSCQTPEFAKAAFGAEALRRREVRALALERLGLGRVVILLVGGWSGRRRLLRPDPGGGLLVDLEASMSTMVADLSLASGGAIVNRFVYFCGKQANPLG